MNNNISLLEKKVQAEKYIKQSEWLFIFEYLINHLNKKQNISTTVKTYGAHEILKEVLGNQRYDHNFSNDFIAGCKVEKAFSEQAKYHLVFNSLYYQVDFMKNFINKKTNSNLEFLFHFAHEYHHIKQNESIKNTIKKGIFNYQDYQNLNNFLVADINHDLYVKNHSYFESEIDAYIEANKMFLQSDVPFFKLYENDDNFFHRRIAFDSSKRLSSRYNEVEHFLKNTDLEKINSKMLNSFTLMEYQILKDYPLTALLDYREDICETITEHMLNNNNFNNGQFMFENTFAFFDYLVYKRINALTNGELQKLIDNVRYDTALKIREILHRQLSDRKQKIKR